jgi:hypothetical protein
MKHVHHEGLKETPAPGTRLLVRQSNNTDEVVHTLYGVVVPTTDVSPMKLADARSKGREPQYVVRWDRATWDTFASDCLDLISREHGQCIEVDAHEEYARVPTPEYNARLAWAKHLAEANVLTDKYAAEEGGTAFLEGMDREEFVAIGSLRNCALDFAKSGYGDRVEGLVLGLAAQHYAAVMTKIEKGRN